MRMENVRGIIGIVMEFAISKLNELFDKDFSARD